MNEYTKILIDSVLANAAMDLHDCGKHWCPREDPECDEGSALAEKEREAYDLAMEAIMKAGDAGIIGERMLQAKLEWEEKRDDHHRKQAEILKKEGISECDWREFSEAQEATFLIIVSDTLERFRVWNKTRNPEDALS